MQVCSVLRNRILALAFALLCFVNPSIAAAEEADKPVMVPFGVYAAALAASRPYGERWMGGVTENENIQCDSFTAYIYAVAGDSLDVDGNHLVRDDDFKIMECYHHIGDGYVPQPGDLVDWPEHVGIYLGNGMVCSRQSGTSGVQTHSLDMVNAQNWFGTQQGWGSVAEATGNKMVVFQAIDWEKLDKVWEAAKKGIPNSADVMKQAMKDMLDVKIPWNFEALANFGTVLNDFANYMSEACTKGFQYLRPALGGMLVALAIIDLALSIILSEMRIDLNLLVEKVVRYGFLFFLYYNWDTILNEFFLEFVKGSIATAAPGAGNDVVEAITQPQVFIQKGLAVLMPGLQAVGELRLLGLINNLIPAMIILGCSGICIVVLSLLALFILMTYVNFYMAGIFALLGLATSPLSLRAYERCVRLFPGAKRGIGSACIRLITMSLVMTAALKVMREYIPAGYTVTFGMNDIQAYVAMCAMLIIISLTMYFATSEVSELLE